MVEINNNFALCSFWIIRRIILIMDIKISDKVIITSDKNRMTWQTWRMLAKRHGTGPFTVVSNCGDQHVKIQTPQKKIYYYTKKIFAKNSLTRLAF